jgi:hypothetical protein
MPTISDEPGTTTLNAHQLRMLADYAESLRGRDGDPIYIVPGEHGGVTALTGVDKPADTLFTVDTFDVGSGRLKPSAVTFSVAGQDPVQLADEFDAVFWSESAVEKFVLPYYASKSMWDAAAELVILSKAWYGKVPTDKDVQPGPVPDSVRVLSGDELPVGLAHTPDSDWSEVGGSTGGEFHALVKGDAGLEAIPLRELYAKLYPPAGAGEAAGRPPRTPAAPAAA